MLIVDAHEDLAYNALNYGRDYTRAAVETRRQEEGVLWGGKKRDDSLLGWPDYQRGGVAVVYAVLYASPRRFCAGEWERLCYDDAREANRLYWEQVDFYRRLADEQAGKFRLVETQVDLAETLVAWESNPPAGAETPPTGRPVGLALLMEGAEGIASPAELEDWWAGGVRWIGLAWAGNRYCGGTNEPGPLTREGRQLLEKMGEIGFGLDISHMDEPAALQALDLYPGTLIASHSNALALLKGFTGNRHLSDSVIKALVERDGVMGILPYNGFLKADWKAGDRRELVTLEQVVAQIDYVCQMAGDAAHVGIGSDFDGGFGRQSVPVEIDTIADLQKLAPLLSGRGYSEQDIAAILGGNWLKRLQRILPGR
jgi:membrane dipeptidase